MYTNAQKELALESLLLSVFKRELLNEMVLKDVIRTLVSQVTSPTSPTMDGTSTRPSSGFWNLKKHLSDMVRAGINPEIEDVGLTNKGMLAVIFKTKSFEHVMTKGPETHEYTQKLVFTDWPLLWTNPQLTFQQKVVAMIKGNIEMHCNCKSDFYHFGFARHSKQADIHLDPGQRVTVPAPIRNPQQFGIGCKHLALIFLPGKVKKYWGPRLMPEIANLMMSQTKDNKPDAIDVSDVPFGPPPTPEREPIVSPEDINPPKPERQKVIEPPELTRNYPIGPMQKTKYGDNRLLSKEDPRWGKPGYVGPNLPASDKKPNIVRFKK